MEASNSRGERGMVTAEAAMVSLLAAGVLMFCLWILTAVLVLAQCQLTANEVARQQARGDVSAAARAKADAPRGARVTVTSRAGRTLVLVEASTGLGDLGRFPVSASATVLDEAPR